MDFPTFLPGQKVHGLQAAWQLVGRCLEHDPFVGDQESKVTPGEAMNVTLQLVGPPLDS